jgi:hypothetical protein
MINDLSNDLLLDVIVWAALGVGLASIAARLIFPLRRGPAPAAEKTPGDAPAAGE